MAKSADDNKKAYKLSVYLLKEDVTSFKGALKDRVSVDPYKIKKQHKVDG